jgi:Zn-finger nucleic acid-binding protein
MNCPNCGETLQVRERSGIEVDVCPVCRGVWLDRGELDKLIDRESRYAQDDGWDGDNSRQREPARQGSRRRDQRDNRDDDDDDDDDGPGGFLQRLTDIFGGND